MPYIELGNEEKASKGNFTFIYDATGDICLFKKFLEAEKAFKINYIDFSHKLRIAYEYFAIFEECKRRKNLPDYKGMTDEDIKGKIIREITTPASILNYKNIIIGLCLHRVNHFSHMLLKYKFKRNNDQQNIGALKSFIRYLYDFGSKSSHVNMKMDYNFIPNKENCLRILASFHDFLNIYYYTKHKFDSTIIPVGDYIAVPEKVCKDLGLNFESGKNLFVKEKGNKVLYYVFSSDIESISLSQKRDIETINKLWEENFDDPSNIIRKCENIYSSNLDYKYQVYSLPGRPLKINQKLLEEISLEDKLDIVKGICRGIMSMHEYNPPFFHRNICPDAFYIFKVKDKFKALLACFDCTKDTSKEALFTVFCNVQKKISNEKINKFFAPEVISNSRLIDIDWQKADIYALAQTCLFILTSKLVDTSTNNIGVIDNCNVNDDIKYILLEMLSQDPKERPDIAKVISTLG